MRYTTRPTKHRWPKRLLILAGVLVLVILIGVLFVRQAYFNGLKPVSTGNQSVVSVTVQRGATLDEIAQQLKDAGLIHNEWVFKLYVSRKKAGGVLQAGTYTFSPSQSVDELVAQLSHGKVTTDLVTIIPGQHLDQIRATLVNYGFDEKTTDIALNPALYQGHPALVGKPAGASLEGYIYPNSYQKDSNTTPKQIIQKALAEMAKELTPDILKAFAKRGLSSHEAIIFASVVEKEVSRPADRAQVAQVFFKRLNIGMPLQSDATKRVFDTYKNPGLPPVPLSNVTASSLRAVANPADTDWLYFVSGDDGTTHFSKTLEQHEANVARYCTKLCGR